MQKSRLGARENSNRTPHRGGTPWRVGRVDVRSPLSHRAQHVARVELINHERGRVSDVAPGADVLSAAFAATAQILGCCASVLSLHSCQRCYPGEANRQSASATIVLDCNGTRRRGTASGDDLLHACLAAFIEAAGSTEYHHCSPLKDGLNATEDIDLLASRPYQASGLDENGDWWLFASEDAGAAEAIADEFRQEGYEPVRLCLPGRA